MNTKLLKTINLLLAVDFMILIITAILHEVLIPLGIYGPLHVIPGILLVVLVGTHLFLNRKWIKTTYLKKTE